MVGEYPLLESIVANCVGRVSAAFNARAVDPFQVYFEKGNIAQTARNVVKLGSERWPLVWFSMPYTINRNNNKLFGTVECNVYIVQKTSSDWTQQEREDLVFKPRLWPIYHALMYEFQRDGWISNSLPNTPPAHRVTVLPYWGLGDVNGQDADNLFKTKVDALMLNGLKLNLREENCRVGQYPINAPVGFPIAPKNYIFKDDIELIVDGGNDDDPVSGEDTVIVPRLIGKRYNIEQRGAGQLRKLRNADYINNDLVGGFTLLSGVTFSAGDTYFINVNPELITIP